MNRPIFHTDSNTIADLFTSQRFRICRHILLQILIMIMTINIALDGEAKLCRQLGELMVWGSYYLLFSSAIYFNLYVLAPHYLEKGKYRKYLTGILLTTAFILIGITVLQIIWTNNKGIEAIGSPYLMFLNLFSSTLAISLMLAGTSNFLLLRHYAGHSRRIGELESTTLQSELQHLKQQINPHFLFNMLNNANVLIRKNPAEASQLLFKMEDLLRYQINDSSKDKVPLDSDIRFLNDFLNLEKIRRDKFEYTLSQEGETTGVSVPPLLFIPFVENAVKHNHDSEHESYVHLAFRVWDNHLTFQCTNSKPAQVLEGNPTQVGGLGLKNIRRRLQLLYPSKHTLEIKEDNNSFQVILHLTL